MPVSEHAADKPARPAIPLTFACSCVLWACCAAAYSLGEGLDANGCIARIGASAAIGVPLSAACIALRAKPLAAASASALLGLALGFGQAAYCHAQSASLPQAGSVQVEMAALEDSRPSSAGESACADVTLEDGRTFRVMADFGAGRQVGFGSVMTVRGTFKQGNWPRDDFLWQNGAVARFEVAEAEEGARRGVAGLLLGIRESAIEAIGSDSEGGALLQAVVCGYRHDVAGTPTYAQFQACGLAHLVAVSGAHLVIVTGLFATALRALRVPRRVSVGVIVAVMATYLAFSGAPVSALRATVMTAIGLASLFGKRRPSSLNALGVGMALILASSPSASLSASFALSTLSTAGIVLFAPIVAHWLGQMPLIRVPLVRDALSLTASAGILSQPYACSMFHTLPLVSPLANVVCAPLFPLVCASGLVACLMATLHLPGASIAMHAASLCATALAKLAGILAGLPYACVPVSIGSVAAIALSVAVAAALWATWPDFRARPFLAGAIAVTVLAGGLSYAIAQEDAIIMLDVGQGDAFLVRSRGSTLLVDTGNHDAQLLDQLARCAVFKLDAVLVTHSDDDHVGSLDALEKAVDVRKVMMAKGIEASGSQKNRALVGQARRTAPEIAGVGAGDSFAVGAFEARVVWPVALSDDGGNADSVCLLLEYDGDGDGSVDFRALLTGDAERDQIGTLVDEGAVGDIDVLKVGHHGSRNGLDGREVRVLSPEIALISVGAGNRYGHPAPETLDLLEEAGCKVYRSDLHGRVKCSFTADAIRVELQ